MKALTVCVPYAAMFFLPDDHPHKKRVENRKWPSSYRGPLLIHSGKSNKWEGTYDPAVEATLPKQYGFIIGVVDMIDCAAVSARTLPDGTISWSCEVGVMRRHPWLMSHSHTSGPFCHIYANARRFVEPIPYSGAQGFFYVPDSIVERALATC
jgi:hypothetical protein